MAKKIVLNGRVQGVGCRGFCARYARKLNLRGAVTNMSNGSVCVLINTDDENIVNLYMELLLVNPDGYRFFGRITEYRVTEYSGRINGDYVF